MTPSFDAAQIALQPATTLIEASAGTGKTYSITGLIIRLLLERDVQIGEIVAVTFTEAATKELWDRVRRRIAGALEDFRAGKSSDPLLQGLLSGDQTEAGVFRLNRALRSFDEAQIFTIHGFCQRCLGDYAFESGASFDANLVGDSGPLFEELARDFWRMQFWEQKQLLAALAISWQQSPEKWVTLMRSVAKHPRLVLIPPADGLSSTELTGQVEAAFAAVLLEWERRSAQIKQVLRDAGPAARTGVPFHPSRIDDLLSKLTFCCEKFECCAPECIGVLADVCSDVIKAGTKVKGPVPAHHFFVLCADFCRAATNLFDQLTREFLLYVQAEMPKRKAQTNTVTYDDLIIGLRDALRGERGLQLAQMIGKRYKAALVDEFQDTDPAQYEIFQTIFGAGRHSLFLIGDPKQAIYGFRGADIFTYREAAQAAADRTFTLTTNWRSEPKLLSALNALFRATPRPFLFDWIAYHDVHAPEEPKVVPLREKSPGGAALRFRLLQSGQNGRGCNQETATELVLAQLVADLAELHGSRAELASSPLRYRDFAVLVRKHEEAAYIQEALHDAGIRSILRTEKNVFATSAAKELHRFLQAVLQPRNASVLKAALLTPLFGLDAPQLYELDIDDSKRQAWLDKFLNLQGHWLNGCFIAMFRQLLVEHSIRARLVELPGGERLLTDFLQLAEVLHEAETARHLAPDALCAFLGEQRANSWTAEEEYQLRLESDADAVQIVTTHKAKGLEYPIVLCPFFWKPAENKKRPGLQFHDRDNRNQFTADLRGKADGEARHREWQSEEVRSDELRLTYVALTRAMNRCYVYVPDAQNSHESTLGMLLGADNKEPLAKLVQSFAAASHGCADALQMASSTKSMAARPGKLPVNVEARAFSGHIPAVAVSASFSWLNAEVEHHSPGPAPQSESPALREVAADDAPTIFNFPRGSGAGDFFHDVLEALDFACPESWQPLVAGKLRLHGIAGRDFAPAVCTALRQLADIELRPGMRLGAMPPGELLRELEFTYALKPLAPADLREVFARCPDLDGPVLDRIGRLRFRPVEGFMRGFIDGLLRWNGRFYLLDWKSNWLGARSGDYGQEEMTAAMLRHNYYLQYHLYTLAADLFLRRRVADYDYERDFGGVFYVFLRGVDARAPAQAIFQARPARETVTALHNLLP